MSAAAIFFLLSSLTLVVCGAALWKGGTGERFTAIVIVVVLVVQTLVQTLAPPDLRPVVSLTFDAVGALALLGVVLRFGSPWLGGVMLFYASQFALQSFYLVTERHHDPLYANVNNFNFLGMHVCLIVGTVAAWRQRVRARQLAASPSL